MIMIIICLVVTSHNYSTREGTLNYEKLGKNDSNRSGSDNVCCRIAC